MDTNSSEIQALDELGRWEAAKLLRETDDGDMLVRFIGWGREYDTKLPKSKVRVAVDPFENGVGFIAGKKRSASISERKYLSLLRSLEAGKEVKAMGVDGVAQSCTVVEVDRFKRTVVVEGVETQQRFTVHASAIIRENLLTEAEQHPKKRKKSSRAPPSLMNEMSPVTTNETSCSMQSQEIHYHQDPTYFQVMGSNGQKVCCGDVVDVELGTGGKIGVGICQISSQSNGLHIEGFIPGSNGVTLKSPIGHLRNSDLTVSKAEKASLDKARQTQFSLAMKNSAGSSTYRKEFRKQQIGCFLRSEVKRALSSKAASIKVSFGLCFCETDLGLFNLDPFHKRRVTYSYKDGNLGNLDFMLGKDWDVLVTDDRVSFVTQVVVSLSKEWVLKAAISTAVSWGPLHPNYREELHRTILNADLMKMAGVLYFENGLRCHEHQHGASCAVDALLELYFHSIYHFDRSISLMQQADPFILVLNSICKAREETNTATCDMRDLVWDFLLQNPYTKQAYAPKGKFTAEILIGLELLCMNLRHKFQSNLECLIYCSICEVLQGSERSLQMLHVNKGGSLQENLEEIFFKQSCSMKTSCDKCKSKPEVENASVTLSDFLMVEIGLVDAMNMQQPGIQIPEKINVFSTVYELSGSVLMEPRHFFNVVKCGDRFLLINGTPPFDEAYNYPKAFLTFSGAVRNSVNDLCTEYCTSPQNKGVHILLYHKVSSSDVPFVLSIEKLRTFETSILGNTSVDVIELSPCKSECDTSSQVAKPSTSTPNVRNTLETDKVFFETESIVTTVSPIHDNLFPESEGLEKPCRKELFPQKETSSSGICSCPGAVRNSAEQNDMYHSKVKENEKSTPDVVKKSNHDRVIVLNGVEVGITLANDYLFLSCREVFQAMGLLKHIKKDGYVRCIDKHLMKLGYDIKECFIFNGKIRNKVRFDAIAGLVNNTGGLWKNKLNVFRNDLNKFLQTEFASNFQKTNIPTQQSVTPKLKKRKPKKRPTPKRMKKKQLTDALNKCLNENFKSDKEKMINVMSSTICSESKGSNDSFFEKDDMVKLLSNAPASKNRSKQTNLLEEISTEHSTAKLNVHDMIHLQENFSGCRLFNELRKLLPGVLPSNQEEKIHKEVYWQEFFALLLPKRTATGWKVDPVRLLELLSLKYYWLVGTKHWKVYGDGREIGGHPSTFIAFSTLNNEAALHNVSFHDPNEVYPIAIFYEKDSRDNLEENLGYPSSWLNASMASSKAVGHEFYLAGDEMFLEAVLDGSGKLAPTSEEGWNIYSTYPKSDFHLTASSGLRTDRCYSVDREHVESILPTIPIGQTVLCILHGLARCVEKLLTLEIQLILKKSNIVTQTGGDATGYRSDMLSNLVNNINKRGVRQGGFNILFDKSGTLCPVKLNKDHALAIIAPAPHGHEADYPHVLHNVCSLDKVNKVLPLHVRNRLKLKSEYTELELVSSIWEHFYSMMEIIKYDPAPCIKDGKISGSINPEDYTYGYNKDDIQRYTNHAECFYQLFKLRYTSADLTPYMMKFIDIAPKLMSSLPFSVGRFQSEGGEHANYQHNRYFFHHTTRHGGRPNPTNDPILQVLCNMYKRISYSIVHGDGTDDGNLASDTFIKYRDRHMNVNNKSINSIECNLPDKTTKPNEQNTDEAQGKSKGLFDGMVFIFCESIPKHSGKSYTHAQLSGLISHQGGRVRKRLPTAKSTKKYTILTNSNVIKKERIPLQIREALRSNLKIVNYTFILDTLLNGSLVSIEDYILDVPQVGRMPVTKVITTEEKHFGKVSMLSLIKKRRIRRKKLRASSANRRLIHHPALYYVYKNLKREKKSFHESTNLLRHYHKKWKTLSKKEISQIIEEWRLYVEKSKLSRKSQAISKPAYTSFISPAKKLDD